VLLKWEERKREYTKSHEENAERREREKMGKRDCGRPFSFLIPIHPLFGFLPIPMCLGPPPKQQPMQYGQKLPPTVEIETGRRGLWPYEPFFLLSQFKSS
jgi:hypothetical protein